MRTLLIVGMLLWGSRAMAQVDIKPIPSDKILTKSEQAEVKYCQRTKILRSLTPAKNDYVDEFNRGTIEFDSRKGTNFLGEEVFKESNYSLHKVIIPDGTIVKGINFAQKNPHTVALKGKSLTFIECNLTNVELDPTWILIDCINRHMIFTIKVEGDKTYEIQHIEKDGKMVENQRTDITPIVVPERP